MKKVLKFNLNFNSGPLRRALEGVFLEVFKASTTPAVIFVTAGVKEGLEIMISDDYPDSKWHHLLYNRKIRSIIFEDEDLDSLKESAEGIAEEISGELYKFLVARDMEDDF